MQKHIERNGREIMAHVTSQPINVDLTRIENAEVRRAMRQLVQQMQETIAQQQLHIEALIELILEKHIASSSEYKRQLQRIAQHPGGHGDRVHTQVIPPVQHAPNLEAAPREIDTPEEGRHVYRL